MKTGLKLVCWIFIFLFHQKISAQKELGHCRDVLAQSDTIIAWFHDKNVYQPIKRKIEITKFNKKWYKVKYEDSQGKIAKRRIHQHRVSKFIKRYYKLAKNGNVTEGEMIQLGLTDDRCFEEFHIALKDAKHVERARHILKIWVN